MKYRATIGYVKLKNQNFDFLFGWIDRLGYDGWIGAEYAPTRSTVESLGWLKRYL